MERIDRIGPKPPSVEPVPLVRRKPDAQEGEGDAARRRRPPPAPRRPPPEPDDGRPHVDVQA